MVSEHHGAETRLRKDIQMRTYKKRPMEFYETESYLEWFMSIAEAYCLNTELIRAAFYRCEFSKKRGDRYDTKAKHYFLDAEETRYVDPVGTYGTEFIQWLNEVFDADIDIQRFSETNAYCVEFTLVETNGLKLTVKEEVVAKSPRAAVETALCRMKGRGYPRKDVSVVYVYDFNLRCRESLLDDITEALVSFHGDKNSALSRGSVRFIKDLTAEEWVEVE